MGALRYPSSTTTPHNTKNWFLAFIPTNLPNKPQKTSADSEWVPSHGLLLLTFGEFPTTT